MRSLSVIVWLGAAAHEREERDRCYCDVDQHKLLVLRVLLLDEHAFGFGWARLWCRVVILIGCGMVRLVVVFVVWFICRRLVAMVAMVAVVFWFRFGVVDLHVCRIVVNIVYLRSVVYVMIVGVFVCGMWHVIVRDKHAYQVAVCHSLRSDARCMM